MPYEVTEGGHRTFLRQVMSHARQDFEKGLQLEAILLAHEYLEQRLNLLYDGISGAQAHTIHRKYKNLIDMLASSGFLDSEQYRVLNEFNRLRNVNSNLILNSSLTLIGAKSGDMARAMDLAEESEKIISALAERSGSRRKRGKKT
jgi:hypothetical protein